MSLTTELKEEIQQAYRAWLESHGFKPRHGQRLMIAEVARSVAALCDQSDTEAAVDVTDQRFCVVEAGTGIGKTVAYTLAALPVAREKNKTLVISTATVALQEQLVNKDLPDLLEHSGLQFSYALAKGRGRYLCLSKLDTVLRKTSEDDGQALLQNELFQHADVQALPLYQSMSDAMLAGKWDGDRDSWSEAIDDRDWAVLTSDRSQCHNRRCSYVSDCSFFSAREALTSVDCIVANHDLVLADLALGGGAILPEPEECVFVFDEGHHLSSKAIKHFSSSIRIAATERWLQQLQKALQALEEGWLRANRLTRQGKELEQSCDTALMLLRQLPELLQQSLEAVENPQDVKSRGAKRQELRFRREEIPAALISLSVECAAVFAGLESSLQLIADSMHETMEEQSELAVSLEQWFPVVGAASMRAHNAAVLFGEYALPEVAAEPVTETAEDDRNANSASEPYAYWMNRTELDNMVDYGLYCAPLLAASFLQDALWQRCAAAVMTSATMSALGSFKSLIMRSGISPDASFSRIASPFDYASNAALRIPGLACDPKEVDQHTAAIVTYLKSISEPGGVLVLFSSRRQMLDVFDAIGEPLESLVLMQDQRSKQALLQEHRSRVDAGTQSFLFGLASFAEGVDLPGKYCSHVVIAKIPFSVPDDPIEEALAEWVQAQGRNAFMEIAVPDAALRLVQASGRLIRSEQDSGTVSLLDRRILERRYGQDLLNSLPPFRREFENATAGANL